MFLPSFMCCIDALHLARLLLKNAKDVYLDPFEYDDRIHPDCRIIGDFNRLGHDLDDLEEHLRQLHKENDVDADLQQHIVNDLSVSLHLFDCDIQCFFQHCKLPLDHLPIDYFYQVYAQCRVCFDFVYAVNSFHTCDPPF